MITKKLFKPFVFALTALLFISVSCTKDNKDELPNEIKTYVTTHFPKKNIVSYEKVANDVKINYHVKLEDEIDLYFGNANNIVQINSDDYKLPYSIFDQNILDYIAQNYPFNYITDWELDDDKYEVELDNGIELEFDLQGNFIRSENEDDVVLQPSDLPQEILDYINTHFGDATILKIVKDEDDDEVDILLSNRIKLTFCWNQKNIIEIISDRQIPDEVLPVAIVEYVNNNFPNYFIVEWELDDDKQEVELNNGIELEFDLQGNFLSLDDGDDDIIIPYNDLPNDIKTYLTTHFPNNNFKHAFKDDDDHEIDVFLEGDVELTFDVNNKVIEIECDNGLPNSVLQAAIVTYVNTHYPNNLIVSWKLDDNKQEVELDNGVELVFDLDGNFLYED